MLFDQLPLDDLLVAYFLTLAQFIFLQALVFRTNGPEAELPPEQELLDLLTRHLIVRQGKTFYITSVGLAIVSSINTLRLPLPTTGT